MKIRSALIIWMAFCAGDLWGADQDQRLEFFESKVRPVLVQHCYRCHSEESGKSKGGLRLDSREGWLIGGDSGPAIVPGKPEESHLFLAINQSGEMAEMPPTSILPPEVVDDIQKWIADGAVDPRDGASTVKRETIDIEAGKEFWSFQPRQKLSNDDSIDGFIHPSAPRASANQLVRRIFLDLIGLPPTQAERQEFLQLYREQSPAAAIETFTDRLLAKREYGEKWARHWLDVARYADSNGGDFNLTFHQAWRYRNYVIDAFNNDLPYDQFLREQIAGDLLESQSPEQRNRQLIATGFLMVAPKMLTERNKAKMHLDIADEQIDTIGRAVMGMTIGCARCHDHKFDPIPTADYYAMAGILHSTRTADRVLMNNVNVTGWTNTDLVMDKRTQQLIADHQSKTKTLEKALETKRALFDQSENAAGIIVDDTDAERSGPWRKSTLRPNRIGDHYLATDKGKDLCSITWKTKLPKPGKYELRVTFGGGSGLAKTAPYTIRHAGGETTLKVDQTGKPSIRGLWQSLGQFTFESTAEVQLTDKDAGGHVIADAIQLIHVDDLQQGSDSSPGGTLSAEIAKLEDQLKKLNANAPQTPLAMAAMDNKDDRFGDLNIRIRGEPGNIGPKAPRGFLQVASYANQKVTSIPPDESGRIQLADWLTDPNHPLTARVMVNRIWQHLFGQGIVVTSDNFGARGATPTHPELLDYLAERFVAEGWSIKTLIREIILSKTYQQSVLAASEDDPENFKLHRQNRRPAPAETMRDSILMIAGELDRTPKDSPVEQLDMYAIQTSGARHASLGQTGKLRGRSVYLPVVRGAVPPSLAVFDFPNPDLVTGTRAATTVPAQALFMMNSPLVREMSAAVADRIIEQSESTDEIIGQLYQRILIRDADPQDLKMGKAYLEQSMKDGKSQREAVALFVQVLFSSTEFRFIE